MLIETIPKRLEGLRIHLVGAKGTGMCALAELLTARGATLTGSDLPDVFYTDAILSRIGLKVSSPFAAANVGPDVELVIRSTAYKVEDNPELASAKSRGLPIMTYPEALGLLSRQFDASGICGVHGKTTTTAIAGTILKRLGLPATVIVGSAVSCFGDSSALILGDRYLVAETCEYQRHFLEYSPRRIVLTSVEPDHQDYYPTYASIREAFSDYVASLPAGGSLIYCCDDRGASEVAGIAMASRPDLRPIAYGFSAEGPYRLLEYRVGEGEGVFRLAASEREWRLRIPGRHIALDAIAAIALCAELYADDRGEADDLYFTAASEAVASFRGSRRRSELVGEAGGVVFIDDYAHHPTAIRETIRGLKEFYPGRRLVCDFMSHTYSRTAALLDDFASSLTGADLVILHKIYASARERYEGGVTGLSLFDKARDAIGADRVYYYEQPLEALVPLASELKPGDVFVTLGAGDNWKLGKALLETIGGQR